MKRVFDLIASITGIIFFLPGLIIISLIIILTSTGPIFFMQKRVGKNGRLFKMYKFRTMKNSKLKIKGAFNPGDTSRVTVVGKFLRKTKLDELPQLINVLKGEMSFVGPRPEVEKYVNLYPERWAKILKVKPGITDMASLLFREEEIILSRSNDPELTYRESILPKKLEIYENYVHRNTFLGDLSIIIKTLFYVVFKQSDRVL